VVGGAGGMPLTMSDEDVKEKFKPVWALMDTNGDGVLDVEEIMKATKTGEEAAKKMIEMMDTDKDGKVSMDEYLAKMIPTLGSDEELDQVVAGEHMLAMLPSDCGFRSRAAAAQHGAERDAASCSRASLSLCAPSRAHLHSPPCAHPYAPSSR
jgi:thioredoxin-like negative regulator of GroEL